MATVGLAPETREPLTGIERQVFRTGESVGALLKHLEGRDGLIGERSTAQSELAPSTKPPYPGTKWKVIEELPRLQHPS
jgi:hypothetical protein